MKNLSTQPTRGAYTARGVEKAEMYNLYRRNADDAGFSVIGRPRRIGDEGIVPLANDPSGVIADDGENVCVIDIEKATTRRIETLDSVARCAVPRSMGAIVMCADGPHYCLRDITGELHDSGGTPTWGAVSITAEPAENINLVTDSVTFGREYTLGSMTESADRTAIQRELERAYERLAADAHRLGVFVAPVIARATVRDADGAVLWRGPELLVMPPGEYVFGRTIEFEMQDHVTLGAAVKPIPTYRLHINVAPGAVQAWNERAARLEIEVSPQFHPWAKNSTCHGQVTVVRHSTNGTAVLVPMPAAEMGLSASYAERSRHLVRMVVVAFDSIAATTAVILSPYDRGVDTTVGCRGLKSLEAEAAAMERALAESGKVATPDEIRLSRMSAPHSFTARHVAIGAGAVLWGNIAVERYRGYSAADMAASIRTGMGWTSCTKVTFNDGSSAVRIDHGTDNAPETLNSLITYPDDRAQRIDVTIEYDDESLSPRRWSMTLEPDAAGLCAMSINTSLAGRTGIDDPSGWITEPGDRRSVPVEAPGTAIAANIDRPLEPAAVLGGDSVIHAVAAARIAGGAWNYGRTRFFIFRENTVEQASTERNATAITATRLAAIGITCPESVTSGVAGSVYFASGRNIYLLTGSSGSIKMLSIVDTRVDRLGYDRDRDEILACNSSGTGHVYHVDGTSGTITARSSSPGPSNEWLVTGEHILAATQDGLFDMAMASRTEADSTDIALFATVTGPMALRAVTWKIESSNISGDMSISRCGMGERSAEDSRIHVEGAVRTPIRLPLMQRPTGRAALALTATVSADTIVDLPNVYC